jgi:hypothetical protein
LIIKSGTIPDSLNGISSRETTNPVVAFCPHLEANLSPFSGIFLDLITTFTILCPAGVLSMKTLSTTPSSPLLIVKLQSVIVSPSLLVLIITLPITTSPL